MQKIKFPLALLSFCSLYGIFLKKAKDSNKDLIRLAAAGSLTGLFCETLFYPLDAINVRSKVNSQQNFTMFQKMKIMYSSEGLKSFYRGYTCTLYGSVFYGFLYFSLYKEIKRKLEESGLGMTSRILLAAFVAETAALIFYYPFELIKVRFISKQQQYGYKSVSDSFRKIH